MIYSKTLTSSARWILVVSLASVFAFATGAISSSAEASGSVLINEFHYKPADESTRGKFIELHNSGDSAVDLSGWSLQDAVFYTFPPDTLLAAGGYLVVAEVPEVILATYGVAAHGPWEGNLSGTGDRIDLRDDSGNLVDRVDYSIGFPWPAYTDGGGPSVERIHPSLDGALAGSWRASGTAVDSEPLPPLIALAEDGWKFKRGTEEASEPVDAWRDSNFGDDLWEDARTPIGFGVAGLNTVVAGMQGTYTTLYLRKEFTVPAGAVPQSLNVRLYLDDGCVIWLNGQEVHRRRAPAGELPFDAVSESWVADPAWYDFTIGNTEEILLGGTNVIAVHLLNIGTHSSDIAFDIQLIDGHAASGGEPTPGRRNSVYTLPELTPPHIDEVVHAPQSPRSGESVTVSARITDPDGVASASLLFQTVDPGDYIRLSDARYETDWNSVPMTATGDTWSATLPGSVQTNRRLVRYRIVFEDTLGNLETVPYADDESPNFAYYVYDGVPDWRGAFRPGESPLTTFPSDALTSIPVYTLIADESDVINSQYNGSFDKVRMTGTFVVDDRVYDHIQYRNRGEGSTYQAGKNKWRFYFNRGNRFQALDADGRPYQRQWKQFSGNPGAAAWAPLNRGASGLDEMVPFRAYQLAGVPSPHTHHYHFRVVRGAEESPAPGVTHSNPLGNTYGQYLGDFWGLYLAVEPIRGNFLSERNLPSGNVYKIEGNNGDKKEQGVGQPLDSSDWIAFRNAHVNANPTEAWWRANLDLDAYYSFHALNRLLGNVDLRPGANHYFYHRSSDDRWVPIPWDLDMMFIPKHHWGAVEGVPDVIHAHKAVLHHPAIALEFRNRAREIIDLFASDASSVGGQIGQLIAEIGGRVHPPGSDVSLSWADAHLWNLHPRTRGTDGVASGQGNHRGNFYRSPFYDSRTGGSWVRWLREPSFTGTGTPDDLFAYYRDYATDAWPGGAWQFNNGDQRGYGYQALLAEAADSGIPVRPVLAYSGEPGFPLDRLRFNASDFEDPQGAHTFAARQWRLAEVNAYGTYEIEALWTATTTDSGLTEMTFPSAGVVAGHTYRARVRQQDQTGRWSHWSEPVEFTAGEEESFLVHYWNFNEADDIATLIAPAFGNGSIETAAGPLTEFTDGGGNGFSGANARFGDPAGRHFRVNNPLDSLLTWSLPTTGFEDLIVRFESRRSGQGAGIQEWSYTTDSENWVPFADVAPPDGDPAVFELDFRDVYEAHDNAHFGLRVTFAPGDGGTTGNNRFDNFTVTGSPLPEMNLPPMPTDSLPARLDLVEGASPQVFNPAGWFDDPENDPLAFSVETGNAAVADALLNGDGHLEVTASLRGEAVLTVSAHDGENPPVEATVRVLVYPSPHVVADGPFSFGEWDAGAPAGAYPSHMLFLQGESDDSTLTTGLDRPYHIPLADASNPVDADYPYAATGRTRINGMGTDGISFINTGRGRDLGSALLALDTTGATDIDVSFVAGTVMPNSRVYGLRLQYRTELDEEWSDLTGTEGDPVEYISSATPGDSVVIDSIRLPEFLEGQSLVQLQWRYHHIEGDSGPRAMLRLDDIAVTSPASPPTGYDAWVVGNFEGTLATDPEVSGPRASPGGDDVPNLLKYALGLGPFESVGTDRLEHGVNAEGRLFIRFQRDPEKTDITYLVEASHDLFDWSGILFDSGAEPPVVNSDGDFHEVSIPADGEPRRFIRLRVVKH